MSDKQYDTQDKRATCPMHDFELPCPSCEMVAIEAGVYGWPYATQDKQEADEQEEAS